MSFRSIPIDQKIYCHLFDMESERYAAVAAVNREIWQRAWDPRDFFYIANLISCPVPAYFENAKNLTASLSIRACKSGDLAVQIRRNKQEGNVIRGVGVCVKVLFRGSCVQPFKTR